jgi:hypothetical protein
MYNELKDGFPAPYYSYVGFPPPGTMEMTKLQAGHTITFSLMLIGEMSQYVTCFIEAIDFMCRKGMGMYSKPFVLSEVRKVSTVGENRLLFYNGKIVSGRLLYPISMDAISVDSSASAATDYIRIVGQSDKTTQLSGRAGISGKK